MKKHFVNYFTNQKLKGNLLAVGTAEGFGEFF
jgi:hypothetical protein